MKERRNDPRSPMQFNPVAATPVGVDWRAASARNDASLAALDGDDRMPSGWYIIPMVVLGIAFWAGLIVWLVL